MIGNIDSQINDRMNTYAGNPQALQQRYAQTQELVDLLALQKMKNDRAAATSAVQGAMQTPSNTVKGQLEQEAMQGSRNDVLRSMAPGIQQQGQRMAQMQNRAAMGIPTQSAPNMARMADGGIVGYADGGNVVAKKPQMPVAGQTQNPSPAYLDPEVATFLRELSNLNKQKANAFPQEKGLFQQKINDLMNTTSPRVKRIASDSQFGLPKKDGMARGGIVEYAPGGPIGANNPFNLRDYNQDWQGQSGATDGFVDFEDEFSGVRAADKLLNNYGTREGIDTLRGAIARFAPPNENLTEDYISFVSEQTGIPSEQPIDLGNEGTRRSILAAMAKMESGRDIDVANVLANDESRFGVTTDSGMSRDDARAQDMQRQGYGMVYGPFDFARDIKGIVSALPRPQALSEEALLRQSIVDVTGTMTPSMQARRQADIERQINELPPEERMRQKEADVPGIPGVLNDMPQPSDAQRFANAFPGAQAAVDQYAEEKASRDEQQPKGGLDIDFRALREFLTAGGGQTSTAGALGAAARGLGAYQTAEQSRQDKINQAALELQLKRDLAVNDANMLSARLTAEYQGKMDTEAFKIAQDALEDTRDPLNQEFQAQAAEIRDKYKREPVVMETALGKLRDAYVNKAVTRARQAVGLGSAPTTSAAITDMGLE